MQIRNFTPHTVCFPKLGFALKSEGSARVAMHTHKTGVVRTHGVVIPVFQTELDSVIDLPDAEKGTILIVSRMVKDHPENKQRKDLYSPSGLVRDAEGKVIGCEGLE